MEAKEIQTLLEKAFADFKAENDKLCEQVKKHGTEDAATRANVETLNTKIGEIQDALKSAVDEQKARADKQETIINRLSLNGGGAGAGDEAKHAQVFSSIVGKAVDVEAMGNYRTALNSYLRMGNASPRKFQDSLSVGSDPDGGYYVTPDTSGRMIKKIMDTSPIRQIANVVTIGTDALEGMIDNGVGVSGGWVGEKATRSETATPQLGKWTIPVHEQYAMPSATQKVLDDAAFDVEGWLAGKVADILAKTENTAFVNGTASGRPRGFTDYPKATTADATRAWGTLQYVASGVSAAIKVDPLISLAYEVNAAYRTNASWVAARRTYATIRSLKDGNGQYLWLPGIGALQPATLLGFPCVECEDMAVIAADSYSLAFGDFNACYQIVDRQGVRVLRDPYTNKPYVMFYTTKRVGGGVVNFEAVKFLKCSAT